MNIIDLVDQLPDAESRQLYKHLSTKFRARQSTRVPREQRVVLCGRILALMPNMSLVEMKSILTFTMATVDQALTRWKNVKRDNGGK